MAAGTDMQGLGHWLQARMWARPNPQGGPGAAVFCVVVMLCALLLLVELSGATARGVMMCRLLWSLHRHEQLRLGGCPFAPHGPLPLGISRTLLRLP